VWDWLPHVAVLLWTATMAAWLLLGPEPAPPHGHPELPDAEPFLRLVRTHDGTSVG
jgi:hypothetical protein